MSGHTPPEPYDIKGLIQRMREVYPLESTKCPWCGNNSKYGHHWDCPSLDINIFCDLFEEYLSPPSLLAATTPQIDNIYSEEKIANARLIAAAPDLLEACRAMTEWFDALKEKQNTLLVEGQSFASAAKNWDAATLNTGFDLSLMRAALAKAEGREP